MREAALVRFQATTLFGSIFFASLLISPGAAVSASPAACESAHAAQNRAGEPYKREAEAALAEMKRVGFDKFTPELAALVCKQDTALYNQVAAWARFDQAVNQGCGTGSMDLGWFKQVPKFRKNMERTCAEAKAVASRAASTSNRKTADCVSPQTIRDKEGLQCVVISNGCSVPIEAYTVAQHKGKPVYRSYTVPPGKKARACQATARGSIQSYIGYCDAGDQKCIKAAKGARR
jgi:hypothetical protein